MLAVMTILVTYIFFSTSPHASACDARLLTQIGASDKTQICPLPLNITFSGSNNSSSVFYVPVLVMKPGGTHTIDILYHLSSGAAGNPGKPYSTSIDASLALSVSSAKVNESRVGFSNGEIIFQNKGLVIFKYTVNASKDSTGYYAILPPNYYGMYPAIAIKPSTSELNVFALSMWSFTGPFESSEFVVPSMIVGTSCFII